MSIKSYEKEMLQHNQSVYTSHLHRCDQIALIQICPFVKRSEIVVSDTGLDKHKFSTENC